jgi:hypothetical protein
VVQTLSSPSVRNSAIAIDTLLCLLKRLLTQFCWYTANDATPFQPDELRHCAIDKLMCQLNS